MTSEPDKDTAQAEHERPSLCDGLVEVTPSPAPEGPGILLRVGGERIRLYGEEPETLSRHLLDALAKARRRGYRSQEPGGRQNDQSPGIADAPAAKPSWRGHAVAALMRLDLAERIEAKGLSDLCMALRDGLTSEQQRIAAQDLLGRPHVGIIASDRNGPVCTVFAPAFLAAHLTGGRTITLHRDPDDSGRRT